MAAAEEIDYYAALNVSPAATLAEIRTAYRQQSLKVHPDRNPDNPEAAHLFHLLRQAFDVLSDPTQKSTFDTLLAARNARKLRFAALDNKRKDMAEDLERREREFKKAKVGEQKQEAAVERLKEEGRKMREAAALKQKQKVTEEEQTDKQAKRAARKNDGIEVVDPIDMTLRVKWDKAHYPSISSDSSLRSSLSHLLSQADLQIDSVVVSSKKGKKGGAVVSFKTLAAAVRVVEGKERGQWQGIDVAWAKGQEPIVLQSQRAARIDDSERAVLDRLTERERIMEQMRREDGEA